MGNGERGSEDPLPAWHLWLDETPRPGWANMAIDHALLDRAGHHGEGWLRLYEWKPHCLSFGRHEPAARRYDADRIVALGLDTVRRPTGGRAVWHGRELTYAVAAPNHWLGSLKAAYLEIHRMLGAALSRLGVPVSLAPLTRPASLDAGACFLHAVGGELVVEGRKVVGSAQCRQGTAFLQHGSILLEDEQRVVLDVSRTPVFDASGTLNGCAPLMDACGRTVPGQEIAESIALAAPLRWRGSWTRISAPTSGPDPVLRAACQHYPQYRSAAWTWER